jgi:hypothetical protein
MRLRAALSALALLLLLVFAPASSQAPKAKGKARAAQPKGLQTGRGLAAWEQVYSVLMHPRCLNCHTATDYPQQGDDRHRHQFNVVRGPDGRGVPGLACATCHQGASSKAKGGPDCADCHEGADLAATGVPAGHGWHLAPLSMAWQDRNDRALSSAQVCRAVTNRRRNMNMGGQELLKHHEDAELVLYAWQPGQQADGTPRSLPPLTHEQFMEATRRWVAAGMPCPAGDGQKGAK